MGYGKWDIGEPNYIMRPAHTLYNEPRSGEPLDGASRAPPEKIMPQRAVLVDFLGFGSRLALLADSQKDLN
jgi:hypothetical protein